jgi:hypothetical protein
MQERILDAMARQPAFRTLLERLPRAGEAISVGGLPGSTPALAVATLARAVPGRLWVVLAAAPPEAEAIYTRSWAMTPPYCFPSGKRCPTRQRSITWR